jgi:RNA polymerase sigma-70 factor (ECF subfamily)
LVLYQDQDETLWDRGLISRGAELLRASSTGASVSRYHLEASIAYWHSIKEDSPEKWTNILQLFDRLLAVEYSPIAALNRTFALAKVRGNAEAIAAARKLELEGNHFYFALLGELHRDLDPAAAREHFERALRLAKTPIDRRTLLTKLEGLP